MPDELSILFSNSTIQQSQQYQTTSQRLESDPNRCVLGGEILSGFVSALLYSRQSTITDSDTQPSYVIEVRFEGKSNPPKLLLPTRLLVSN